MSSGRILRTPLSASDLEGIRVGDILYLTGHLVTCRGVAYRRLVEGGRELPVGLRGGTIFHAGPIVRPMGDGAFEMVSIGPTTSMRMEKFEKEFVEQTGVRLIIGKGGMGPNTEAACRAQKALHVVFPAGCAVLAATRAEEIEDHHWDDLGMPETLWVCRVRDFGPLIVSIDTAGNNLFERNKVIFNEQKEKAFDAICREVSFIKWGN